MRKVKISQRYVYYKYAQVEIFVPNTIEPEDLDKYLFENEDVYINSLKEKLSKANYEDGFGLEHYGMCDIDQDTELRYDLLNDDDKPIFGGHI